MNMKKLLKKLQAGKVSVFVFLFFAAVATVKAQKVLFVDSRAVGDYTGKNWENACTNINQALEIGFDGSNGGDGGLTVFVRPGVYEPIDLEKIRILPDPELWPEYNYYECCICGVEGAEKTIIDAGFRTNYAVRAQFDYEQYIPEEALNGGFWMGFEGPMIDWNITGFTLRNAEYGLMSEFKRDHWRGNLWNSIYINNCVISNCEYGVYGRTQYHSANNLIVNNENAVTVGFIGQNCTITGNNRVVAPGEGSLELADSIVWNNGIYGEDMENPYTLGDPLFVNPAAGDFRLRQGSPCINSGTGNYFDSNYALWDLMRQCQSEEEDWSPDWLDENADGYDLALNHRVQRGKVDVGCYEFQPTNDTQTITTPIPIDFEWIETWLPARLAQCNGDHDEAARGESANVREIRDGTPIFWNIWESFIIGLDPADPNAVWRTHISFDADGKPVVTSDPELPNRRYKVLGKRALDDDAPWSENCEDPHFFKLKIEF